MNFTRKKEEDTKVEFLFHLKKKWGTKILIIAKYFRENERGV